MIGAGPHERAATPSKPALHTAEIGATVTALRAIVEHRDELVKTRTQTTLSDWVES